MTLSPVALTAVIGVVAYYSIAWFLVGRDPKPGTVVVRYDPPDNLSPAMLRYIWKESFDDRAFWAAVLSVVSKGLATLHTESGTAVLRPFPNSKLEAGLPLEESLLMKDLLRGKRKSGIAVSMMDGRTTLLLLRMADTLKKAAGAVWFRENREFAIAGTVLSLVAVVVVASPRRPDSWITLMSSLSLMAPATFYLFLLLLRIRDLSRAARNKFDRSVLRRVGMLLIFLIPCICSIVLGGVVLGGTWGWPLIGVTAFLLALDLAFSHSLRAPTADGRKVLDEIEGFRLFLQSVEKHPLNLDIGPGKPAGAYERYLPYAVALEVEQAWGDRFIALALTSHAIDANLGEASFYLGMWNGKPVEIVYAPRTSPGGRSY